MRKLIVIGIGAGNPEHVTIEAINALNRVDVFFHFNKGERADDLARLRKDVCERYIRDKNYRFVEIGDPNRSQREDYQTAVHDWHRARADLLSDAITNELREKECGAILVWGDPSLYDSTIRILDLIQAKGSPALAYEVIPGISSIQVLAARHRMTLNAIGGSVHITTGRKLAEGGSGASDSIVAMLDSGAGLRAADGDLDVYWGAYLGTPDEILVSGKLRDVVGEIDDIRLRARADKGWMMETYLLRRSPPPQD